MTHPRTAARAALASVLSAAIPAAAVYKSRSRPGARRDGEAVMIDILTPRETSTREGGPRVIARTITLAVAGHVTGASEDDRAALADALALEIEQAVAADITLGGAVIDIVLTATDMAVAADAWGGASFVQTFEATVVAAI